MSIVDTLKQIKWKLKPETRQIEGFQCHRADAFIAGSLYVIAFFCDEIKCGGGPESFNGLPRMILGAVLPKSNITWFATGVHMKSLPVEKIAVSTGTNIMNRATFAATLKKDLKNNPFMPLIFGKALL